MTIASSVLTTADINGGTIDGTVIGGSTPAAGTFTTGQFGTSLNVDGTITSDGLTVDGNNSVITTTSSAGSQDILTFARATFGEVGKISRVAGSLRLDSQQNLYLGADYQNAFAGAASIIFMQTDGLDRVLIANNGDISFYEDTGTTPKFFWDASAEALGIGTTAPKVQLDLLGVASTYDFTAGTDPLANLAIINNNDNSGTGPAIVLGSVYSGSSAVANARIFAERQSTGSTNAGATDLIFEVGQASGSALVERLRIDSSGNVGVGTTSPSARLEVNGTISSGTSSISGGAINGASFNAAVAGAELNLGVSGNTSVKSIKFNEATDWSIQSNGSSYLRFITAGTERMRIDSSGNVGIGTSSPIAKLSVVGGGITTDAAYQFTDNSTTPTSQAFIHRVATRTLAFGTDNTERMRITSTGNVGIGTTAPLAAGSSYTVLDIGSSSTASLLNMTDNGTETGRIVAENNQLHLSSGTASGFIGFRTGGFSSGDEAMRIDSSGNLLVGTTSTTPAVSNDSDGIALQANGTVQFSANATTTAIINRKATNGDILQFRKDGTTVGSIGTFNGAMHLGSGEVNIRFVADSFRPATSGGSNRDNAIDLGSSSARFDDIYATNGTIQTSDRNEKQDIEELDEAERRVAVAAKSLLRKFRWKSAVEEKGDDARIHFGIIAQDLQAAFEAEGLDAGRYAMFIHSTWTDEETGEEKSRMGVRYPQLLAFIIAAT
jgi:hypothetical protein